MPSKIYLKTSIRTLMPTIWLLLVPSPYIPDPALTA